MAIKGNFRMGGIDYSTPSLNNNINYAPSFVPLPPVIDPVEFVPSLPSVTNEMPSNRQPGLNISNDMIQEDMMKEVVKIQLQDLQQNKDILQNIDAGDGSGRNLYQTEIQDIITKSPLHQEAYLEEYPIGGTINTVVPDIMETVAKTAVPGLGIASEILDSFNINPKINNDTFSIEDKGYGSLGEELFGNKDLPGIYGPNIEDIKKINEPLEDQLFIQDLKDLPGIYGPSEDITNINISDYLGGDYGTNDTQIVDIDDTNNDVTDKTDPRKNTNQTVTISPYSTGLNYAMSIADGSNVPNMIAPSMSYSAANPEGFTQADINAGLVRNPFYVEAAAPMPKTPDDPYYLGTGIGGVNIPTDRHDETPKNIFGGFGGAGNQKIHISHTGLDEQIGSGYKPLNLAGIQKVLDNLS